MSYSYSYQDPPNCCSSPSAELKRRVDWLHLQVRTSNRNMVPISRPSEFGLKKELREMLPTIVFKESCSAKETQCSVCLGDYQPEDKLQQIPACGHTFHLDCIGYWLATHTTCPLCRTSLLSPPTNTIDPSDDVVVAEAHEAQCSQEFVIVGNSDGTSVQVKTRSERVNNGEERGSYCINNEEEFPDARRELGGCCGGEISAVLLNIETHGSIEQELGSELPSKVVV